MDQIDALIKESADALEKACELAKQHGISFSIEGPAYGMGGSFNPERKEDRWGTESDGWLASSQSC